jgi:hypothetical protein
VAGRSIRGKRVNATDRAQEFFTWCIFKHDGFGPAAKAILFLTGKGGQHNDTRVGKLG